MTLTRSFKETVKARAERDEAFREALLREGVECEWVMNILCFRAYPTGTAGEVLAARRADV